MAQRRISRALANFGASLQNIADAEMQNRLIKERQAEESRLIGERQAAQTERERINRLTEGLRTGVILPQQVTDKERQSITGDPNGNILAMTPPESNVIGPIVGDLSKITESGKVPSAAELMGRRLSSGAPLKDLTGINSVISQAASQKDRLLASEATDRQTAITQAGNLAYEQGMAQNRAANDTLQDVLKRGEATGAQANRLAGERETVVTRARIQEELKFAGARLANEAEKARMLASIEVDKQRQIRQMQAIDAAASNAASSLPRLYELADAWKKAEPELAKKVGSSEVYASLIDNFSKDPTTFRATIVRANLPPAVNQYFDKLNASLSYLARSTGEVGNLAGQEQLWQRYGAPSALDVVQGTANQKIVNMLAFATASPELARLNARPDVIALDPEVRLDIVEQIVGKHRQAIQERMFPQGADSDKDRSQLEALILGR